MAGLSLFEVSAAIITAVAIWLTSRQSVWCWPVSLVSTAMYVVVYFQARLYADSGLYFLYGLFAIYGWWLWTRGETEAEVLRVTRMPRFRLVVALGLGAIGAVSLATALSTYTDAAVPWADSTLVSFSLVAQWMTAKKHLESWVIWIVVDVFYVALFINRDLIPTAILHVGLLVLAVIGFVSWRESLRDSRAAAGDETLIEERSG